MTNPGNLLSWIDNGVYTCMKNGCRREGAAAKEKEIANNGKRQEVSRRHHFHGRGFRPVVHRCREESGAV